LKIERYQRRRILTGLDPACSKNQQSDVLKVLQSLKFIQKYEDNVDESIQILRQRTYDSFLEDPLGRQVLENVKKEREQSNKENFAQRIQFIEATI